MQQMCWIAVKGPVGEPLLDTSMTPSRVQTVILVRYEGHACGEIDGYFAV
jgi:hypothetical protein